MMLFNIFLQTQNNLICERVKNSPEYSSLSRNYNLNNCNDKEIIYRDLWMSDESFR